MVISHKYKYLFIGLPFRASTAIHKELCELYAGEPILGKHSLYYEFEKIANDEEKSYKVVACVRNPMDFVISYYLKLKSNVHGKFTNDEFFTKNGGHITAKALKKFRYVQRNNSSFEDYFLKYYKLPYTDASTITLNKCDFIINFHNLDYDFKSFLEKMGIEPLRNLPKVNQTSTTTSITKGALTSFYTDRIKDRAKFVFAPYLKSYNLSFPEGWGEVNPGILNTLLYYASNNVKKNHWKRQILQHNKAFGVYADLLKGAKTHQINKNDTP